MKVVVGIPDLNEERSIAKVVLRCKMQVKDIMVVDDGSKDDTGLIARSIGADVVTHEKNMGKGESLRDCFKWAREVDADVLVTLDADGQHDPSFIPRLVEHMKIQNADVVVAGRTSRPSDMPRHRWVGQRGLDHMTGIRIGDRYIDSQSGFRAYSRKAIDELEAGEFGMGVDSELLVRAKKEGLKIVEVQADVTYSGLDTSNQNPVIHGLDVFFSLVKFVSIRHPLLFYGGFSLLSFIISVVFGLMTLDYYQHWGRVITNLALISIASGLLGFLSLFTGIVLFTLITVIREKR